MVSELVIVLESLGWDRGDNVEGRLQAPQSMRLMVLALSGYH